MIDKIKQLSRRSMLSALAVGSVALGASLAVADNLAPATTTAPAPAATTAPSTAATDTGDARIIVVEWKIKKGHEQEFLDYWSQKSTIPDRSGLIGEFMTTAESKDKYPFISWASIDASGPDTTVFYNVGFWKKADAFVDQIGKYVDLNRPPLPFESEKRHRVFLQPLRWRIGMSSFPTKDADGVK